MPNYPKIDRSAVDQFLKVYNQGGLHLLFDSTSRQAMVDFANIALASYYDDLQAKAKAAIKARQPKVIEGELVPAKLPAALAPAPKSSIILTD